MEDHTLTPPSVEALTLHAAARQRKLTFHTDISLASLGSASLRSKRQRCTAASQARLDMLRSQGSGSSSLSLSRQESWCSCEHLQNIWYSGERFTAAMASVLFLCLLAQASGHWFTCQASKH